MSTNIVVPQNIDEGTKLYKKRLLPAVISEDQKTINALGAWMIQNGYDVRTLSAEQVCDALYRATNALVSQIRWVKPPAKLIKVAENEKVRNQTTAKHEQDAFAERAKQAEAAKEKQKLQDAAFRRIDAAIAAFQLKDTSGTRIMYGRTSLAQDKARKFVQKQIEAKADMEATERAVRKYLADLYEEDERSREHV